MTKWNKRNTQKQIEEHNHVIDSKIKYSYKPKNTNILDVKVKNYGECGYCKEQKELIKVPSEIFIQWIALMWKMDDKEWGGVYDVVDGVIQNFRIPEQEVSGSTCEFKEDLPANGIIHSHHTMGSFHSGQDDAQARNLYDYSLVISSKNIIGTRRKILPCGGFGYIPLDIQVMGVPEIDTSKIKLETPKYEIITQNTEQTKQSLSLNDKEEEYICFLCNKKVPEELLCFYDGEPVCLECYQKLSKEDEFLWDY